MKFADFMLTEPFSRFNNVDTPADRPKSQMDDWDKERLLDTLGKLNRELLRRDTYGTADSPFEESNAQLHVISYALLTILKSKM
ncbi:MULTISPECIES: hypothetical protein [Paenibacillus]|uniref:hypothetical protein n=1 Tax=Paenibacillus TaxID=44249 RepID=UPI0022B92018|nr:hypothetical protein [Paenibacillus caseinilyticus]MCZ8523930.1 hypothetical protein [Paenibacillus caseinilyticus]